MTKRYVVIEEDNSAEGCVTVAAIVMFALYLLNEAIEWLMANLWIVGIIAVIVIIVGIWWFKKE